MPHIFFNEEKALDFKNSIWCSVLEQAKTIEERFSNEEEASIYIEDKIFA